MFSKTNGEGRGWGLLDQQVNHSTSNKKNSDFGEQKINWTIMEKSFNERKYEHEDRARVSYFQQRKLLNWN